MTASYLLVRVADEEYALPVESVREVARDGHLAPVPGAPSVVLGVRNLRGQVMPVINLAGVLGLASEGNAPCVAVVEHAGRIAAFAVDGLRGVAPLEGELEPAEGRFLAGAALEGDVLVGVVAVDEILATLEEGPGA